MRVQPSSGTERMVKRGPRKCFYKMNIGQVAVTTALECSLRFEKHITILRRV